MKLREKSPLLKDGGQQQFLSAGAADEKKRLDIFLTERLGEFSRSQIQKWIKSGHVLCDQKQVEPSFKLKAGQVVAYHVPEEEVQVVPENMPLEVLYEDDAILAVNKSAGIVTHPAHGHLKGTLLNAVAYHLGTKELSLPSNEKFFGKSQGRERTKIFRPGIVHRLDRDTSGVLLIAKTTPVLENLSKQFRDRSVKKVYRAIVCGKIQNMKGEIVGAIGKDSQSPKMAVTSAGRFSETHFKVLKLFPRHSYVEVFPKTGRTHQIRVHFSKIGHPVLGDSLYGCSPIKSQGNTISSLKLGHGGGDSYGCRQMLHAYRITIRHPKTKKEMTFTAPFPADFLDLLKKLDKS